MVGNIAYFLFIVLVSFTSITYLSEAQDTSPRKVTAMYVFGDSLVDVGNNNHLELSLAKANFPHNGVDYPTGKATGRFCNGKNAADFIAEKLGLPTATPYLSIRKSKSDKTNALISGVSFASGGAGVFNGTDELFKQSIPLTKQVEYYTLVYQALVQVMGSAAAQQHLSNSVFPIVIGSNDLFGYFKSGSDVSKKNSPQQYVQSMLSALNVVLKRLRDLGARKFIIVGIGAVGCTPSQRVQNKSEVCNEEVNFWATKYNDGLTSLLKAFKSEYMDINYSYFDAYSAFVDFIQNPSTYGFTEVKAACCGLGQLKAKVACIPISTYCTNRNDHLFWDLYHPTQKAAGLFVDMIFHGSKYVTPMNVNQLIAV
ncbi:hypothetical protein DCAR_0519105 [Daucus carota subsp. sativus]|uniref:Uncharacterized protein n=1 Tax=Daucus carota subsp. sativus TaxID=79200 RepID=A0A161YJI9_DAUCS|nr:PREDICTED: GDSL esterase/lipase At5g55050 [Daucus carota subsp. sativus]WOG99750.1 hypothetical protein DCAR_0519105 [Daucus carota subsp. sativus]